MWTCPHCGKASEAESGDCPQCAVSLQDDDRETEEERRESTAVDESDFTPLQFSISHVMAITALFALAFGMYRLIEDLSHDQMQILYAWGSVGFAVLLVAAIFGLCRRG